MSAGSQNLARQPTPLGERRHVTILFADMVGYTAAVERLGEEKAVHLSRMIYDKLTSAVHKYGGAVRGFAGDSVMAVFGVPDAQEDAALRACRAAVSIQSAFAASADDMETEFGLRPSMRVGVSSGVAVMAIVEADGGPPTVVGPAVNLASRVQTLAPAGGCLICDSTRRLVEWLVEMDFFGEHAIKGVARPQKLWRLMAVRERASRFDASLARGLSEYVGRSHELALMLESLVRARDATCVMDLVAEPGLGKTRLVFEFLEHAKAEGATVLAGHCSPDGQQAPFYPFLEIVRGSFRIRDDGEPGEIARKLESGLRGAGLHTPENLGLLTNMLGLKSPEGALAGLDGVLIGLRTRDLLPALLKAQCRKTLVVLQVEDIHWIDGASEQLLRRLIENGEVSNLLVVHTRRPEYAPAWRDSPRTATLALQPLAEAEIRRLALARLAVDTLPETLVRQLTERAGGNPLFAEEILSFLLDQGALRVADGAAEFDAASGESGLPASMQSLLAARIERLPPEDRVLLQAAAAIGRRFDPGLLALVVGEPDGIGAALRRLQAEDVVRREAYSSDYVFKHALLRDTVYQSMVASRRTEAHFAVAQALERRNADRVSEAAESLAYHYSLTDRADLAFAYNVLAGAKSLGVYSLEEAERYFACALALSQREPDCVGDGPLAAFLADYGLCLNISLRVGPMIALAEQVRTTLARIGDSRDHVHFLHHHVASLLWNGRYFDALGVRRELSAMATRLGDPESIAYALVSELAVSCYCEPLSNADFEGRRREAEAALSRLDDAYLQNFFFAHMGWNEICRGRVSAAHQASDRLIAVGMATQDPRSLGYGTAMKALIAMITADYQKVLELSEQTLAVSRAEFERAIAAASKHVALVPLGAPGAVAEVERYVGFCAEKGWTLFLSTPDTMLGVGHAMEGRIGEGLRHIETSIARREREGYQTAADWYRLFLCEIYLQILAGEGGASLGVLLRNIRSVTSAVLFGRGRIASLIEKVRSNPQFDADGHHIGHAEMILGLLYKIKNSRTLALRHLTEARRIVAPFGPSPMLSRIEAALEELSGASAPGAGRAIPG
jgi:class 3 adenylate cyclase